MKADADSNTIMWTSLPQVYTPGAGMWRLLFYKDLDFTQTLMF